MNRVKAKRSMQCPNCGSHYTQSVSMAYSQSVRTGESGYTTISEFGESLAPPMRESEVGVPLVFLFFVGILGMILLPMLGRLLPFEQLANLSSFDFPVVLISVGLGTYDGFRCALSALIHNRSIYRDKMSSWSEEVICRRCGHRY